ncbi:MAG: 7-cyano-7-deazaguanine synthase [Planctomycetes bacterium]|nr:7-cyano-7-deazaguanine synthase [Planctomycetota bacterium]MBU4399271.1 7-cyano-7-deazaguanine synthase [Planctomycetota bacterium]MCG2685114.1 7-cyano-7-deazaguanine synthase [Planctomycetales bacterium]
MNSPPAHSTIGVLASGGLDSCILIAHLLRQGHRVRPFYVRCELIWEEAELAGVRAFLRAMDSPRLEELVTLALPLRDLYGRHWSVDGRNAPDAQTPAGAVYLPGRNALLTIKPAIWCGINGIGQLALAVLAGNPFADATDEFFRGLETTLEQATGNRVSIMRPFAKMDKREVLRLGRGLPLDLTFSCLSPAAGLHCGRCNKCAERQEAFRSLEMHDPTRYANQE